MVDVALDFDFQENEWMEAAAFQLPLDVRRATQQREATMSDEVKQKREKRREKTKKRREGREAAKQIGDEEKEEMRLALQSASRHLALT